jgi:hypothetical protein
MTLVGHLRVSFSLVALELVVLYGFFSLVAAVAPLVLTLGRG